MVVGPGKFTVKESVVDCTEFSTVPALGDCETTDTPATFGKKVFALGMVQVAIVLDSEISLYVA